MKISDAIDYIIHPLSADNSDQGAAIVVAIRSLRAWVNVLDTINEGMDRNIEDERDAGFQEGLIWCKEAIEEALSRVER